MPNYHQFYIDGAWVSPIESRPFVLINPATETEFATISLGSVSDVNCAVAAARKAFATYSSASVAERIELLESIAAAYIPRQNDFIEAMVEEIGSPRAATVQASGGLEHFRQAITTLRNYTFDTSIGNALIRREPIGVCGLITPWNWPVQTPSTKIAAASRRAANCAASCAP